MRKTKAKVQEMALFAYQLVSEVKNESYKTKYLSYVRKLPSMIVYNGLLGTVVFAKKKASKDSQEAQAWGKVLKHIESFLKEFYSYKDKKDILEYLSELSVQEYRLTTKLVLDFSIWLKNIAEGEIRDEAEGN
ncbi:type III-B CRISPR module-associated protein Cmr5 [Thermocrinis sp.]